MASFNEIVRQHTDLNDEQISHITKLIRVWNILADLSFADLILAVPVKGDETQRRFIVASNIRPTTGTTLYQSDLTGVVLHRDDRPLLEKSWSKGEIVEGASTTIGRGQEIRVEVIPVVYKGDLIAVLRREYSQNYVRVNSSLERAYINAFERLAHMISDGTFPYSTEMVEPDDAPRIGDGVLVINNDSVIQFASPNAISNLHRLGIHTAAIGAKLNQLGWDETSIQMASRTSNAVTEEIERDDVSVLIRIFPILNMGRSDGILMMMRDVTEVRRRDRLLLSKEATIREVHHRVKNNLQTIAALLRLQARRLETPEAKLALAESERRIRSIAIVHEILAREATDFVKFSEVIVPLVDVIQEATTSEDVKIEFNVKGDAGILPGEIASPLAIILNELMQNAVDHAFDFDKMKKNHEGAKVDILLSRDDSGLSIIVADNGIGLSENFDLESSTGLGTAIMKALVITELCGTITMNNGNTSGTISRIKIPLTAKRSGAQDTE
ncbi:MAG: histidine kinase N-terminal domain-containing protein [Acidimicrobiia bacterium]|nr:histidine kinase N-terminal domain-containing protein [Acidimicrobiia bacterium]